MAELVCKDMLKKTGREGAFFISSAATSSENVFNGVGAPVYGPIRSLLESKGISCAGKRAQVLTQADGDKYELFLCMDESNVRNVKRILGERYADKCKKLLSFAGESGNVADPWYTRNFEDAYTDIKRGLEGLLNEIL
jgi:protein-tyrosine phosphatase